MADEMLFEMFNPIYDKVVPYRNYMMIFLYKTMRFIRGAKLSNDVFDASFANRVMDSIVAHIKHPETIFGRGER